MNTKILIKFVEKLVINFFKYVEKEPNVVKVHGPTVLVGDIHG